MADLITQAYVTNQVPNLTSDQTTALPAVISAASGMVEDYCNRIFGLATYNEVITDQPFSGQILLRQFPVNHISRLAGYPTSAISIKNTATSVQRATVELTTTGDITGGLTLTGLALTTVSSATTATNTITISSSTTLSALAASINAYSSSGWSANVATPLAQWAATDLIPPQGTLSARNTGANFEIYSTDLNFRFIDATAGIIEIYGSSNQVTGLADGSIWFPGMSGTFVKAGDVGYPGSVGGSANGVRATYSAGFATIPIPVQQATLACVQSLFDDTKYSQKLQSASQDDLSYSLVVTDEFMPDSAKRLLHKYIDRRIK